MNSQTLPNNRRCAQRMRSARVVSACQIRRCTLLPKQALYQAELRPERWHDTRKLRVIKGLGAIFIRSPRGEDHRELSGSLPNNRRCAQRLRSALKPAQSPAVETDAAPRTALIGDGATIGEALLRAESQQDARVLRILVGGNLPAMAQLIHAVSCLTDEEQAILGKAIDRSRGEYAKYIKGESEGGAQ